MPLPVFEGLIAVLAEPGVGSKWAFGISTAHTLLLAPPQNKAAGKSGLLPPARAWSATEIATAKCRLPGGEFAVVKGVITSVDDWFRQMAEMEAPKILPDVMWSLDRRWFVATNVDLDSTLLGVAESLVPLMLGATGLEMLESSAEDSLA